MELNGMDWNGMVWNGMEWNRILSGTFSFHLKPPPPPTKPEALGKTWNGMEWNGLDWIGMEWNGILFYHDFLKGTDCLSSTSPHRPSLPNPPDIDPLPMTLTTPLSLSLTLTLMPDLDPRPCDHQS